MEEIGHSVIDHNGVSVFVLKAEVPFKGFIRVFQDLGEEFSGLRYIIGMYYVHTGFSDKFLCRVPQDIPDRRADIDTISLLAVDGNYIISEGENIVTCLQRQRSI